jgi:hypothetical protein
MRLLVLLLAVPMAWAGPPPGLSEILPRGGQRGTTVAVTFQGTNLHGAAEVLFHRHGISASEIAAAEDGRSATAHLTIAPDCAMGLQALRLRTSGGVSNLRLFSVGNLAEIQEAEPNSDRDTAQAIELNSTINGVITSEDIDYFAFDLNTGDVVAVEVEALRLGSALFDPKLWLFGPEGHERVAEDDTPLMGQDAAFVYTAIEDGLHTVAIGDAAYGGANTYRYRLHIGHFPRPLAVTPMGGAPDSPLDVRWLGDPRIEAQTVAVPAADPGTAALAVATERGVAPSKVPFRVSAYPGVVEVEPNNEVAHATSGAVPGAFDGVIEEPGDEDWFAFEAKKGEVYDFRVWARALGSPLDSVLTIANADGGSLASDDDGAGIDSSLRFTVPEDGLYAVGVRDHLRRGGPTFAYRVEATPVKPSVTLRLLENDAVQASIPQSNHFLTLLLASRAEFDGDLAVAFEGLPAGVTVHAGTIPAGQTRIPIVFEAAADAPVAGALADVQASHGPEGQEPIRGGLLQNVRLVPGDNDTTFYGWDVDRVAVAVAEPAPFRVAIVAPTVPLVRQGRMDLRVVAERAEGFTAPIELRMPWTPPGVSAGTAQIAENASEATLRIEANNSAAVGTWDLAIQATSSGYVLATPFTPVEVAAAWVTFAVDKHETEQGKDFKVPVQVTHAQPFEGSYEVALSLVGNLSTTPQSLTKDTTELVFEVTVPEDAPAGKHSALVVSTTIEAGDEPVFHWSGGAELVVHKPLPPELQEASAPEPEKEEEEAVERKSRFGNG